MTTQPLSLAIIMDGNRRYAKEHGIPMLEGHRLGYKKLKSVVEWAKHNQVKYLTVYAFSTENWNRTEEEVELLMTLFAEAIKEVLLEAKTSGVRIMFLGERGALSPTLKELMAYAESETRDVNGITLGIALSYGGRSEIISAIRRIPRESLADLSESMFSSYLFTKEVPDPDLIIRTGGEHRLSNFLPWQSVYSELYFVDTLWPDFSHKEFDAALTWYRERDRRRGM